MKRTAFLTLLLTCMVAALTAQPSGNAATHARRALLIGISDYQFPSFTDLPYPHNDVARLAALLRTPRYGFADPTVLTSDQKDMKLRPTRENILAAMRKFLETDCQSGDVCIFYYSGHGSRVLNSLSRSKDEDDGFDETIVPMDADRPQVDSAAIAKMSEPDRLEMFNTKFRDIRDKEIADLLDIAAKKGVVLTAIFDSCHSGSIGRGPRPGKSADAIDAFDLKVPSEAARPDLNGAVVLSAAKDYQLALGDTYDFDGKSEPYSHFTAAILTALYRSPGDTISLEELFDEARAGMVSDGRTSQTPVIEGQEKRRLQTLFGEPSAQLTGRITATVVKEKTSIPAHFIKGVADGIGVGAVFTRIRPAQTGALPIQVRITGASLDRSDFDVIDKAGTVTAGDVFEQTGATPYKTPNLTVWLPPGIDDQSLTALTDEIKKLDPKILADEPVETESPSLIYLEGSTGTPQWKRRLPDMQVRSLGSRLTADSVKDNGVDQGKVFVAVPPTTDLRAKLTAAIAGAASSGIAVIDDRDRAMYELAGKLTPEGIRYAWILRSAMIPTDAELKAAQRDETASLSRTEITDWRQDPDELALLSVRLAKIGDLLKLDAPQQAGGAVFPYVLETRDSRGNVVAPGGKLSTTETYRFVLKFKPPPSTAKMPLRFYAYLINIDSLGNRDYTAYMIGDCGTLASDPNLAKKYGENCRSYSKAEPTPEIILVKAQPVCTPVGSETEILVFTDQRWEDVEPGRSFDGVRGLRWNGKPRDVQDVFPRKQFGFDGTPRAPGQIKDWAIQYHFFSSVREPGKLNDRCRE